MAIPGFGPCFYCNGTDHWHDKCWTRNPPTGKDHHEARLTMYRDWADPERCRVKPHQRRQLIEHENKMWREKCATERKSA